MAAPALYRQKKVAPVPAPDTKFFIGALQILVIIKIILEVLRYLYYSSYGDLVILGSVLNTDPLEFLDIFNRV